MHNSGISGQWSLIWCMRWVPIVLVDAEGKALANPCLVVNLLLLSFSSHDSHPNLVQFLKRFVWKVPVENDAKGSALCQHVFGQPPLPCDAPACRVSFTGCSIWAPAPHPPPSSPFSCKWRLPNTGGEDTAGCESVQEWLRPISAYLLCFHVTSPPTPAPR